MKDKKKEKIIVSFVYDQITLFMYFSTSVLFHENLTKKKLSDRKRRISAKRKKDKKKKEKRKKIYNYQRKFNLRVPYI